MLRRLGLVVALGATAAMVLVGCSPAEPLATTPAAEPTIGATVGEEEQVLQEAVAAAESLLTLVDEGFATGTLPVEELEEIAAPELVEQLESEVAAFAGQGLRTEGRSRLDTASLVDPQLPLEDDETLVLLSCLDTSGVTTTDASGERVSGGVLRQPRMFKFTYDAGNRLEILHTAPPAQQVELAGCGS